MIILGIETSCDETAISVVEALGDLSEPIFKVRSSVVHSQVKIHEEFGGVVPNLAKREHQKNLPLVLKQALTEANVKDTLDEIDLIVVTIGPGLEPALWTGITFAEELGNKYGKKVIGANHMLGHVASVLPEKGSEFKLSFPLLALLISGGHTELVVLKNWKEKEKIGETLDDAVGEAFDKVARMLGAPYPGGPEISRLAEEARNKNIKLETKFPRPMIHSKDLNFSFSGLKTAVLYYLQKNNADSETKQKVAREFEDAVIETLLTKTKSAIEQYSPKTLIIGGGVIANKMLRAEFLSLAKENQEMEILMPEKSLTTDNATMIAVAGFIEYLSGDNLKLEAKGNLEIS
jgi:N6-L-threonylcarbamoyladenine synthase